jgi:hypothetical protein
MNKSLIFAMLGNHLKKHMLVHDDIFHLALNVEKRKATGLRKSDGQTFPLDYPKGITIQLLENSFKKHYPECQEIKFCSLFVAPEAKKLAIDILYINKEGQHVKKKLDF